MRLAIAQLNAARAQAGLEALLAELACAGRHGNLDRIARTAVEALAGTDRLASALSALFALAAEQAAEAFDKDCCAD